MSPAEQLRAKEGAEKAVREQLGPGDLMALLSFGNAVVVDQELTNDKDLLLAALDRHTPGLSPDMTQVIDDNDDSNADNAQFTADNSEFNLLLYGPPHGRTRRSGAALRRAAREKGFDLVYLGRGRLGPGQSGVAAFGFECGRPIERLNLPGGRAGIEGPGARRGRFHGLGARRWHVQRRPAEY